MKKVEVKLSLPVVAPLLDVIKAVADTLKSQLAVAPSQMELDADMRQTWDEDLLFAQNAGVRSLLAMFDRQFFETGTISFDEENAEPILRACAALRLQLREQHLKGLDDETLETSEVDIDELAEPMRAIFMCYVFLATIQEVIIQHLDSEILDG